MTFFITPFHYTDCFSVRQIGYGGSTVHFYRNVFSVTPRSKVKLVAKMLKAIHAQESKKAAREKARAVVEELRSIKLKEAAKKVEDLSLIHI